MTTPPARKASRPRPAQHAPGTSTAPSQFDAPNPGDPGFEQPIPKTPADPTNLPELPPQQPFPRGI